MPLPDRQILIDQADAFRHLPADTIQVILAAALTEFNQGSPLDPAASEAQMMALIGNLACLRPADVQRVFARQFLQFLQNMTVCCSGQFVTPPIIGIFPDLGELVVGNPAGPGTVLASGGIGPPYVFQGFGFPSGLSVTSDGIVSGTPTISGSFAVNVVIHDPAGNTGTVDTILTVGTTPSAQYDMWIGRAPTSTITTLTDAQILALPTHLLQSTRVANVIVSEDFISPKYVFVAIANPLGVGSNTGDGTTAGFAEGAFALAMADPTAPDPFGTGVQNGYYYEDRTPGGVAVRLFRFYLKSAGGLTLRIR